MIESINLIENDVSKACRFIQSNEYNIHIDHGFLNSSSFSIEIKFEIPIVAFRQHDYSWKRIDSNMLANWYSPKLVKLENQQLVQANRQVGIWEVDPSAPKVLLWHFNPHLSEPLAAYDQNNNKHYQQSKKTSEQMAPLCLLFPRSQGMEVSRSKIPFSAIACFTDHCDFDTLENLQEQRLILKRKGIRITKGFFLNHYSKREVTANFEMHKTELLKWLEDGHELAYHSLSQSVKPVEESIQDFINFVAPKKPIPTWIDHGFQHYNVSLYKNHARLSEAYGTFLEAKGIQYVWNYIDSGTVVKGVINQVNPNHFTLQSFYKGISSYEFKSKWQALVKNIIFHHIDTAQALFLYRDLSKYLKSIKRKKSIKKHLQKCKTIFQMFGLLLPILFRWNTKKKLVYPLAKFTPVLFQHHINGSPFTVFQTVELIDFKTGLCKDNIDLLIKENGLFVGHTYFSAPLNHHHGKFFGKQHNIDPIVEENFDYLSMKINNNEIWNPTLAEFVDYFKTLETIAYDCDQAGSIFIKTKHQLPYRYVS